MPHAPSLLSTDQCFYLNSKDFVVFFLGQFLARSENLLDIWVLSVNVFNNMEYLGEDLYFRFLETSLRVVVIY